MERKQFSSIPEVPFIARLRLSVFSMLLCCLPAIAQNNAIYPEEFQARNIPEVSDDKIICFALYTVHDNILKLNTQLYPLRDEHARTVRLEIKKDGEWSEIARTKVIEDGWTALFRIENWDSTQTVEYRVAHGDNAFYTGRILRDPVDKETIVVCAFTGNSIYDDHGGDIPRTDIVENINKLQPDLLFFSGDQVYDHEQHLKYWLKFGEDFGDAIRNYPTITIPDDHDVGQANLWGEAGGKTSTEAGDDGGYFAPAQYVKQVERAQTSHLPDPYDPTAIGQGIGVYYTALNWGRISFAIIEDRKFKSGPNGLVPKQGPRPDHIRNPNYDPKSVDVPGAVLLGERQLKFLREWTADWENVDIKTVLSQTIFCGGAHIHGGLDNRLHADMDSNGWPQTGRNKALSEIRKGFAFMLAGDQHLGSVMWHGIDEWNDSGYSFCVPSIANLYLRWWDPLEPGKNRSPGNPEYTGEFKDGFDNKITVFAVANPEKIPASGDKLTTRAAGFGVVKFNKTTREIIMECWPRKVDITAQNAKPYSGWPITIKQEANYGRKAVAYLPILIIENCENSVVQVIDESNNEIIYTLRIHGNEFRPKVFKEGMYTLKIGKDKLEKTITGIKSLKQNQNRSIEIKI